MIGNTSLSLFLMSNSVSNIDSLVLHSSKDSTWFLEVKTKKILKNTGALCNITLTCVDGNVLNFVGYLEENGYDCTLSHLS